MPPPPIRRGRLAGLKGPPPKRCALPPTAAPKPAADSDKPVVKPCCAKPEVVEEEGLLICKACFTQVGQANIIAEVTFEEQTGGRATVQGGTVAENSRHAKTLGAGAYRKVGGGERNSYQDIQNAGRRALQNLCPKLGIVEHIQLQAESIWTLAANINFSAGRKTDEVISACLYAACRRQRDNKILLIDIAELVKINVFRLGEVYKDMCRELYLQDESVGYQYLQELEPLIKKYCDKLQFADKTKLVAEDALKIIRRMNRDWIVAGRHPAGLCGACIILAARMNNFQRSVREVVWVSKVADVTISKRVEEFRRTRSAGLTVDEFRKYANKIKHQHDPPAMSLPEQRQELAANRKRKREDWVRQKTEAPNPQLRLSQQEDVINVSDVASDRSSRLSSVETGIPDLDGLQYAERQKRGRTAASALPPTPPVTQQPAQSLQITTEQPAAPQGTPRATEESSKTNQPQRSTEGSAASPEASQAAPATTFDEDGFARPALPVQTALADSSTRDPSQQLESSQTPKRSRGRTKKTECPPPIDISQEELDVEDYLELQIEEALKNGEVQEMQSEVEKTKEEERIQLELERAKALTEKQQTLDRETIRERREQLGYEMVDLDSAALEAEFEDDDEVKFCLLTPDEIKIKEQIWLLHNEDWLRKQAEKEMMAEVAKATNTSRRGRKNKKDGKLTKAGKKRSRMGDGSVLTNSSTPIVTPADAARAMLEKRANKSHHVDFSVLQRIYERDPKRVKASKLGNLGVARTGDSSGSQTAGSDASQTPGSSAEQTEENSPADGARLSATPVSSVESDDGDTVAGGNAASPRSGPDGGAENQPENNADDADVEGEEGQEDEMVEPDAEAEDGEDDDVEEADDEAPDDDNPARSAWDDVSFTNPADDDEEDFQSTMRNIGRREEEVDEFGVVDNGFDAGYDGDDYEEYE